MFERVIALTVGACAVAGFCYRSVTNPLKYHCYSSCPWCDYEIEKRAEKYITEAKKRAM